jgi:hypothetical protein
VSLVLGEGLLRETFTTFKRCGAGKRECVVYWAGRQNTPGVVTLAIHPTHRAAQGLYEIDQAWLNRIWFELADEQLEIRAQVHTHQGQAFHSKLDDDWPLVQTVGFLSLVIPQFGLGRPTLDDSYLVELTSDGTWRTLDPRAELKVMR